MNKNKKIIFTFSLIIVIMLSFLLFFGVGSTQKTAIQGTSFAFIILDEILVYSMILILTETKQKAFAVAGLSTITCIYIGISFIVNLFIKNILTMKSLLITNFSFLLIYLFVDTMILLAKEDN